MSILPFMLWYLFFFFLTDNYETTLPAQRQARLSSPLP